MLQAESLVGSVLTASVLLFLASDSGREFLWLLCQIVWLYFVTGARG